MHFLSSGFAFNYNFHHQCNYFFQDLIDMTLKKMDLDKDGRVSYSDFEETVKREPLMMEAFGPYLPNNKIGFDFMQQFLDSRPNNSIYHV